MSSWRLLCGAFAVGIGILAGAACDDEDGGQAPEVSPTPSTGSPTATPAPSSATPAGSPTAALEAGFHDQTVRTGVAAVDAFLDALANSDAAALRNMVVMTSAPCATYVQPAIGPNPGCPPGTADGTLVDVFLSAGCQPGFIPDLAEAQGRAAGLVSVPQYVYVVYEGGFGVPFEEPAAFTVAFGKGTDRRVTQVSLDNSGRIIGIVGCNTAGPDIWEDQGVPGDNRLILPPAG